MSTQKQLVQEFFKERRYQEISQSEVTEWCRIEWKKRTGKTFEDVPKTTRNLAQIGWLQRVEGKIGVFFYDPDKEQSTTHGQFTDTQKEEIFKKDNYTCKNCGATKENGVKLAADHIKPIDKGGKSIPENGQTLCERCNNRKKNYDRTEFAKREFIDILKKAEEKNDSEIFEFAKDILEVYDNHNIDAKIV